MPTSSERYSTRRMSSRYSASPRLRCLSHSISVRAYVCACALRCKPASAILPYMQRESKVGQIEMRNEVEEIEEMETELGNGK